MKQVYLIDTCVFIRQFRDVAFGRALDTIISRGQLLLSAIVAMELYTGTENREAKFSLDALIQAQKRAGLLSTPDFNDYRDAGMMLRAYSARHGRVTSSPHFRDILIALGAAKSGAAVVTDNRRDFIRWQAELKHSRGINLAVLPVAALAGD